MFTKNIKVALLCVVLFGVLTFTLSLIYIYKINLAPSHKINLQDVASVEIIERFIKTENRNETMKLLFNTYKESDPVKGEKGLKLKDCPREPPSLVGLLAVSPKTSLNDLLNDEVLKKIKPGGVYKPSDCKPVDNVAVIIPYRDRQEHLDIFLMHIHTVLQRQMLQYTIYVAELALPTQFNRGILANIGFVTAASLSKHTCYIIHDVDLLPANDKNMYTCSASPRHLSVAVNKFNYKLPYPEIFGGINAFTEEQFCAINGFPNRFFGWGAEDDELYLRTKEAGYNIERPPLSVGRYEALNHGDDSSNPKNPARIKFLNNRPRPSVDGLSTLDFNRLALEFRPLYTWVYVEVKEQNVIKPFLDISNRQQTPNKQISARDTVKPSLRGRIKTILVKTK